MTKHVEGHSQLPAIAQGEPAHANFMLLLMEAVAKDQDTMDQQQVADGQTTESSVGIEEAIYSGWNSRLASDANFAAHQTDPNVINQAQIVYNSDSAQAQANESQQDGQVQAAQGATSSDSQNLATKAQLSQGINTILTMLSNLLGQV